MCGCGHDDPLACMRARLEVGEQLRPCNCDCHVKRSGFEAAPPAVNVAHGLRKKDTKEALVQALSELCALLEGDKPEPVQMLGQVLCSVGTFAHQTDDARATAALCYAGADAIRAARKVFLPLA